MSYCVFCTQKIKSKAALSGHLQHNYREYDESSLPANIDSDRSTDNVTDRKTRQTVLTDYARLLPDKVRKNAVHAVEFVFSASHDWEGDWNAYFAGCRKWADEFMGAKNCLSWVVHMDEATPHVHAIYMPLIDGKLNAREIIGGTRGKLAKLRTDFWKAAAQPVGLERGTEWKHSNAKDLRAAADEQARAKKELSEARERLTARSVELDSREIQLGRKKAYFDDVVANRETYEYALKGEFALHDKSPEKLNTQDLQKSVKRVMDSMAVAITTLGKNIKELKQKIFQYREMTPQQLRNTADAMDAARIRTLGAYEDAQRENLQKQRKKSQNKQQNDWGR